MKPNQFAPRLTVPSADTDVKVLPTAVDTDPVNHLLLQSIRWVIVAFVFLLPIFFLPGLWITLGFQKTFLAVVVLAVVSIAASLLMLRTRTAQSVLPVPLALFIGVLGVAVTSAVLSPDVAMSLRGSVLETQTVAFMGVLFGVMTMPLLLQHAKRAVFYVCAALGAGLATLLLFTSVRLVFGPILALGSFFDVTQSPAGSFNDLALLAGLTVMLVIIALLQLQFRLLTQVVLASLLAVALFILAVVNFFYVWLVVGFFGLLVLLYLVSYDMLFSTGSTPLLPQAKQLLIALSTVICVVSGLFIVVGDYAGQQVASLMEVDYLEVRPSFGATADIASAVYDNQLLLGVGPNQFVSAWRQHKDVAINETLFWNTDFVAGTGYIPTLFVTLGLLGGLSFVLFHLFYLWLGVQALLKPTVTDPFWYFVALFSFVGASFLWAMSYLYVPGAAVLLVAAVLTGLSFAAFGDLQPVSRKSISLVTNHSRGFALMAVTIICVTGSLYVVFTLGEQYVAQASFNKAQAAFNQVPISLESIAAIDQAALASYNLFPDQRFLGIRTQIKLRELNELLSLTEPTEADQQRFLEVSEQALGYAAVAVASAPTNPEYHALLANIYNAYAIAGEERALELSQSAISAAEALDPRNPVYALVAAQMAIARGDVASARTALERALEKRRNFTEALYLLAQLDIAEGDVQAAITTTQAIIRLEPQNPARYYQLGILYTAAEERSNALAAYERALTLDAGFANARYLRALVLLDEGRTDAALVDLRLVAETNSDNVELTTLINALVAGEVPVVSPLGSSLVGEATPETSGQDVTSVVAPDTDLITPLNTVPSQSNVSNASTPAATTSEQTEASGR